MVAGLAVTHFRCHGEHRRAGDISGGRRRRNATPGEPGGQRDGPAGRAMPDGFILRSRRGVNDQIYRVSATGRQQQRVQDDSAMAAGGVRARRREIAVLYPQSGIAADAGRGRRTFSGDGPQNRDGYVERGRERRVLCRLTSAVCHAVRARQQNGGLTSGKRQYTGWAQHRWQRC